MLNRLLISNEQSGFKVNTRKWLCPNHKNLTKEKGRFERNVETAFKKDFDMCLFGYFNSQNLHRILRANLHGINTRGHI